MQFNPMNIDTRNRDCGVKPESITNCSQFVPGPEPKQARYGRGIPEGTDYSGLLECPCTERYGGDPIFYPDANTKIITNSYVLKSSGLCKDDATDISTAPECFAAARGVGVNASSFTNKTVSDPKLPAGCSIVTEINGSATVYFNSAAKHGNCGGGKKKVGQASTSVKVNLGLNLDLLSGTVTITVTGH